MDDGTLTVELAGEVHTVEQDATLTFGRAADLVVDDANRYLHRILGRFSWHGGWWWVENLGSSVDLELVGDDGTLVRLAPRDPGVGGAAAPLTSSSYFVRFEAGGLRYELEVRATGTGAPSPGTLGEIPGETTSRYGYVKLTDDERLLVDRAGRAGAARPGVWSRLAPSQPRGRRSTRVEHHQVQPQARLPLRSSHPVRRPGPAGRPW